MIPMKWRKYTKTCFICLLASSILCGMLNFASVSHAKLGKWTEKADMPTPRMQLATAVVNGKIYAIGGLNGGSRSAVEEYDPQRDIWTKKADMPTARGGIAASAVDGKIYVFGGHRIAFQPLDTVQMYDPAKDKWTQEKTDADIGRPDDDKRCQWTDLPHRWLGLSRRCLRNRLSVQP